MQYEKFAKQPFASKHQFLPFHDDIIIFFKISDDISSSFSSLLYIKTCI